MALNGRTKLLVLAKMWAYPLWWSVMQSASADAAREDVDWWAKCINNEELINLDAFSKFAYFTGALPGISRSHALSAALLALAAAHSAADGLLATEPHNHRRGQW